jgi:hypothetical protein
LLSTTTLFAFKDDLKCAIILFFKKKYCYFSKTKFPLVAGNIGKVVLNVNRTLLGTTFDIKDSEPFIVLLGLGIEILPV